MTILSNPKITTLVTTTLTAAAGDLAGTAIDVRASRGGLFNVKLTNGADGPTTPAEAQVQHSWDGTNWDSYGGAFKSTSANAAVNDFPITFPAGTMYVRAVGGTNDDGDPVVMTYHFSKVDHSAAVQEQLS